MTHIKAKTIIGAAVLLGAACGGGSQVPAQELAQSSAAIRGATEAGATQYPEAAAQLQLAQKTTERAQKVAKDGDIEGAKALLKDAQTDADLALALTRSKDAEAASKQAKSRLEGLK
jgi:hypothetical protein